MKKTDFNTYKKLKEQGFLTKSQIPKTVFNSHYFQTLEHSGIIYRKSEGRGFRYIVKKIDEFEAFFTRHFPNDIEVSDKVGNVAKYRDSKIETVKTPPVFLVRGFQSSEINSKTVDLAYHTQSFGLFACSPKSIQASKICIVENLDTFSIVEEKLGQDYIYIHKYGRFGENDIQYLKAKELLIFVDYDFNGLDEYLRIKSVLEFADLYIPPNYDSLFERYSKKLTDKNKAQMSKRVENSEDPKVIKIREDVIRNHRFLEQQAIFY